MKKRGLLAAFSIFLMLVLIPNVFSIYKESVYSGTVNDRDILNISGTSFEFRIDSVSNKLYVAVDASALIIPGRECKIKGSFDICIGNISFSHRNYTDYIDIYKAVVSIYLIKSKVDIKHTIGISNLLIDEETTAELAIENTADIAAKDVTAAIAIPSHIMVTSAEGCKKSFETVIFKEDVFPRQIRKCIYKIRGLSGGSFELAANVTYFDGIEQVNAASTAVSGKVYNQSLKISQQFNKSRIDMGEKVNLTINLENTNDKYSMDVTTFSINMPDSILIVTRPRDASGTGKIISWSGTLAPKEKKSLLAELQSYMPGNFSIPAEAAYKESNFLRTANSASKLEVYCDCPYISHVFSVPITAPNQETNIAVSITNPSRVYDFKDVRLNYFTNIPFLNDLPTYYIKISPLETIKIFSSSITGPASGEVYHLNITTAYESSANKVFFTKYKIIMKVPESKAVEKENQEKEIQLEKANTKKQQESEEKQETKESSLVQEKAEEPINTSVTQEAEQETPATTISYGEGKPIKSFTIVAYISALAFILVILIVFRKRRGKHNLGQEGMQQGSQESINEAKQKEIVEDKDSGIREFFSLIFKKNKTIAENPKYGKRDLEYESLEKEINRLGSILEEKKQRKGLLGRIFGRR